MLNAKGYAAQTAKTPLAPFEFTRRDVGPKDVLIEIKFCGVCHSDVHQARDEWGRSIFPMVPGHEIVGLVRQVGRDVRRFTSGDHVGVGCFVDSCRTCGSCKEGLEQYCETQLVQTYNGTERDGKTQTYGGYSNIIVVDENYVLSIPKNLDLKAAAPLLCAGITTYSPLRHFGVKAGQKVGVMGLGGLGHMAVKLAASFGAEVTVLSSSRSKEADAKRLGAKNFVSNRDEAAMTAIAGSFHCIVNTVAAPHDVNAVLNLLRRDGTMVMVGAPSEPLPVNVFSLIMGRRRFAGSLIGGIKETQEMLDYCGKNGITSDIELIPMRSINEAYDRMIKGDVKYRFVIDVATL